MTAEMFHLITNLAATFVYLPGPSNPANFLPGISPIMGEDICLPKTSCSVFQSTKIE